MAAHRWLVLVLGLAVVLRVAVAITYRPALFFNDSWNYLNMAYERFPVGFDVARPSGYPLVIKALSVAGHHLMVFTTMQHLAGLAVGLLVYLLLTRGQVPRWLAAAATGVVLLDLYAITLEQTILAEAFFTLALFGAVYLAIRAPPTAIALSASGALLAAAVLMRVAGAFAFPVWFLYLAWKRVGLRPLVVALLSFAIPLLAYAGWQKHVTGHFGLVEASGWFLYGRIGEIASPCGDAKIPASTRPLCERRPGTYGCPACFYTWSPESPANKLFVGPWYGNYEQRRQANRLLRKFAMAIIRDRPLEYGQLVLRDFGRYFQPGVRSEAHTEDLPTTPPTKLSDDQQRVVDSYLPGYLPRNYGSPSFLPRLERWLHTPRWLMAIFALCALVALASAVVRRKHTSDGNHGEATFLVGSGLLILLGGSTTSEFDLRYPIPEVPLFVCGGVLAIWQLSSARSPSSLKESA
jgi:hypothetical protein